MVLVTGSGRLLLVRREVQFVAAKILTRQLHLPWFAKRYRRAGLMDRCEGGYGTDRSGRGLRRKVR
jgi:hypothetical protein